jgi:hypothetical protein
VPFTARLKQTPNSPSIIRRTSPKTMGRPFKD